MNGDTHSFDVLKGHKYMNLTVFRKSGRGVRALRAPLGSSTTRPSAPSEPCTRSTG
jgi:hypothetical protein